jgi:aspartate kinase
MKFGGTSVEDPAAIGRTAAIVAGRVALGKQPVVVVSAMAKVTDQLLRAAAAPPRRATAPARWPSVRACARAIATPPPPWSRTPPMRRAVSPHRSEVRLARRDSARPGGHSRTHPAHLRPDRQLRRAHLQPHRRRGLPRAGIDAAHVDAREVIITDSQFQKAVPQDAIIEKRAAGKAAPAHRARARCRSWAASSPPTKPASPPPWAAAAPTSPALSSAARSRRGHRNLDRRGRHHDRRPARLPRCPARQGHQL